MAKIMLFGFMGAGKTTVGKKLSHLLGVPFLDSDTLIEQKFGPITAIFEQRGEAFFRKAEEETIAEILKTKSNFVLSAGGGAILSEKTRNLARLNAVPIYLKCDIKTAFERTKGSGRPLAKDFESFVRLFSKRKRFYENLPFFADTSSKSPDETAKELSEFLRPLKFPSKSTIEISVLPISETKNRLEGFYITDENVFNAYAPLFEKRNGITIAPSENSKTMQTILHIYEKLLGYGITRNDVISYVGGGVTGDVSGFAASTLLRGIPLKAFPTTLLSMTDSAIGGKNGVNLLQGKNLVGTFYFPEKILINPVFLWTLPESEIRNGSGEVFKYAVLSENGIFELLEKNGSTIFRSVSVKDVIAKSVNEKIRFVEKDPLDKKGIRAFLNLGHTVGHAVEKLSHFKIKHGEAVAFGIVVSAFYSMKKGLMKENDFLRILALYDKMGFEFPNKIFSYDEFFNAVFFDKKREGNKILWIVPVQYNRCVRINTDIKEIAKTYEEVANENTRN